MSTVLTSLSLSPQPSVQGVLRSKFLTTSAVTDANAGAGANANAEACAEADAVTSPTTALIMPVDHSCSNVMLRANSRVLSNAMLSIERIWVILALVMVLTASFLFVVLLQHRQHSRTQQDTYMI